MFIDKVRKTVQKHGMLRQGDRVVVAVSGGPDSVCLLLVLRDLAQEYGLTLHVAHLDHRFRGEGSAADAAFVRILARQLGAPATVEAVDVPAYCAERGLSPQAGAREVRYGFLERVARDAGCTRIALGHTANDQAETLLLRLVRGAGVSGLAAIPPVRENIVRPLIDCTRDEVLAFLKDRGQDSVTDPTNLETVYARNRIRLELLPLLERFNPRIVEALAAEADILRDEDGAMEAMLAPLADRVLRQDDGAIRISRDEFNGLLPALRRRLLRMAVCRCGEGTAGLSRVRTREAMEFMTGAQTGRTMELAGGLVLTREYDELIVGVRVAGAGFHAEIGVPGETSVSAAGLTIVTSLLPHPSPEVAEKENNLWQAQFDYDKISLPLCVRSRLAGDRFQPAGMAGGTKKLQDLFIDEKVPRLKRLSVPILATPSHVLWVIGMRTDGRFLPGPETKQVLRVTIRKDR